MRAAIAETLELKESKENAHSNTIWSVNFSPDGSKIVSGSLDQTIKVWDSGCLLHFAPVTTPIQIKACCAAIADTLELKASKENAHHSWVRSVDFSPDGSKIVSGSWDQTIKVWDSGFYLCSFSPSTKAIPFSLPMQRVYSELV